MIKLRTIIIIVIDVNDNYPIFTQASYAACLEENLAIGHGTVVTAVTVTDKDLGVDGVIEYLLNDVPGSENFGTDNETGVIHTIRYIDREVYPCYPHSYCKQFIVIKSLPFQC